MEIMCFPRKFKHWWCLVLVSAICVPIGTVYQYFYRNKKVNYLKFQ